MGPYKLIAVARFFFMFGSRTYVFHQSSSPPLFVLVSHRLMLFDTDDEDDTLQHIVCRARGEQRARFLNVVTQDDVLAPRETAWCLAVLVS